MDTVQGLTHLSAPSCVLWGFLRGLTVLWASKWLQSVRGFIIFVFTLCQLFPVFHYTFAPVYDFYSLGNCVSKLQFLCSNRLNVFNRSDKEWLEKKCTLVPFQFRLFSRCFLLSSIDAGDFFFPLEGKSLCPLIEIYFSFKVTVLYYLDFIHYCVNMK